MWITSSVRLISATLDHVHPEIFMSDYAQRPAATAEAPRTELVRGGWGARVTVRDDAWRVVGAPSDQYRKMWRAPIMP